MEEFLKERNEAFLSLDEEKIREYCTKYEIEIPEDEVVFWAGVHKTICVLYDTKTADVTEEMWKDSCAWLANHGYSSEIKN